MLAAVLAGCADLNVSAPLPITRVTVAPDSVILRVGDTVTVRALAIDSSAAIQVDRSISWTSASPAIVTVDASGHLVATGAGVTTLTATVEGINGQAAIIVTGAPTTISLIGGNTQSAAVNTALPVNPSVRVSDAGGNPVALVDVAFAVVSGNGTVAPLTVTTGVNGIASSVWTMGPSPGTHTMTATGAGSLTGNPITFTATATVGTPSAAQSSVVANPDLLTPSSGSSFSTITVTVRDSAGSTISGATVTLSASGSGNLLTQPTDTTDSQGQASGALSSSVAENKVITATVNGTVVITQRDTIVVSSAAAAGLGVFTQPAGAVANAAFTTQPVVDIRDAFGNRVPNATNPVTVTLVGGNGTLVGTATVNAVAGRAAFSGLVIKGLRATTDTLGTGPHVLQFSAPGFTAVRSDTFQVGVSFAYNIVDVFARNCNGCHGFTYANVTASPTTSPFSCAGTTRIVASDTTNSFIYGKIKTATPSCGGVMPTGGLMSQIQIRLIRDWILQGALNN